MKVTESARKQFNQKLAHLDSPGTGVRIYTTSGCCFPTLLMDVGDQAHIGDKLMTVEEIDFFIADEAKQIINKLIIDFTDDQFKFGLGRNSKG